MRLPGFAGPVPNRLRGIQDSAGSARHPTDPWENWSRKVFGFNESLDRDLLKPVATAYSEIVPEPRASGRPQFLRQRRRRLFGLQPGAAGAIQARRRADHAIRDELDLRACWTHRHRDTSGNRAAQGGPRKDFRSLGNWQRPLHRWPLLGPSSLRDSVALPLDRRIFRDAYIQRRGKPEEDDGDSGKVSPPWLRDSMK